MSKRGKWTHLGNSFEALRSFVNHSDGDIGKENKDDKQPSTVAREDPGTERSGQTKTGSQVNRAAKTPHSSYTDTHRQQRETTQNPPLQHEEAPHLSALGKELVHLHGEVATYKKKLTSLNNSLKQAELKANGYREHIQTMDAELRRYRDLSERLYQQLEEAREHNEFLESELEVARSQESANRKIKKICSALEKEKRCLEESLKSYEKKLNNAKKRNQKLSKENKTLVAEQDRLQTEVHSIETKLRKVSQERLQLETMLSAYRTIDLFDLDLLCSLAEEWDYADLFPDDVARVYGKGPLSKSELRELLNAIGITPTEKNTDTQILILGRESLNEARIERILETWINKNIFVYSQELFIFALLSGKDPFQSLSESKLRQFADGHPGLEFLLKLGFEWPFSEYIPDEPEYTSTGNYLEIEESPLKKLGYTVGLTHGLPEKERRKILSDAYQGEIPSVGDERYMEEWSGPGRVKRLWRIAHHLHWLCYSRKNNPKQYYAIADWSSDLDWLKQTYYRPWMGFRWPDTHLG